jgi:hypothetical protein
VVFKKMTNLIVLVKNIVALLKSATKNPIFSGILKSATTYFLVAFYKAPLKIGYLVALCKMALNRIFSRH